MGKQEEVEATVLPPVLPEEDRYFTLRMKVDRAICPEPGRFLSFLPERKLMAAVLGQALRDVERVASGRRLAGSRTKEEQVSPTSGLIEWFELRGEQNTSPYSFEAICDVLGLPAEDLGFEVERYLSGERTRPLRPTGPGKAPLSPSGDPDEDSPWDDEP